MCGRYTLTASAEDLAGWFGTTGPLPELVPSYNIAPTQEVPVVGVDGEGERRLRLLKWGLVPSWANDPEIGARMINARAESVADKPAYRAAFKRRRCLIPADGFYEWQKQNGGPKQPFHVKMENGEPFAFAGLWESWQGEEETVRSCAIITTDANEMLGEIHDRMPVILSPDSYGTWLDPELQDADKLLPLLQPCPPGEMEVYPVSRTVNSPANDEPSCVEPLQS